MRLSILLLLLSTILTAQTSQITESTRLPKKITSSLIVVDRFIEIFSDGAVLYDTVIQQENKDFKFVLKTSLSIFDKDFKAITKVDPKDKIAKADKLTLKKALKDFQVLAEDFAIKNKFLVVYVDWGTQPLVYQFAGDDKQIRKDIDKIFKSMSEALLAGKASIRLSVKELPEQRRDAVYDTISGRSFIEFE